MTSSLPVFAFFNHIKQIDSNLTWVCTIKKLKKTSKQGKDVSDTLSYASCTTFLFLPHFDVICNLFTQQEYGNIESIC